MGPEGVEKKYIFVAQTVGFTNINVRGRWKLQLAACTEHHMVKLRSVDLDFADRGID